MLSKNFNRYTTLTIQITNKYRFGVGKLILHYIRTVMNRIRWEQNRQFTQLEQRKNMVPRNTEQANQMFIASQRQRSLSERARMERIDKILGTQTYFHQTKLYQERLDSDHIMDLEQLKKKHAEPSRQMLDWTNPQADIRIRYKNKRKYYRFISKMRVYPVHKARNYDFANQTDENTINFLGNQTVYSKISLKELQLTIKSMQDEAVGSISQVPFESRQYCYFRPLYTMQLFRISKSLYIPEIVSQQATFQSMNDQIQQIVSLQELYDILKEYDLDERVSEYLRKVQNNRIEYLISELTYDHSENIMAIMIDLLGTKKEYCLIVKNLALNKKQYKHRVIFNVKPSVVFSADGKNLYYIQRSPEGGWIELVSTPVQNTWYKSQSKELEIAKNIEDIMYRCSPEKQLLLGTDSNKHYTFMTIREAGRIYTESLFIIHRKKQQQNQIIQLIEVDKDSNCRYFYDVCPLGLVFVRFREVSDRLKYGSSRQAARQVYLVPYKQHIQLHQQQKIGLAQSYLPVNKTSLEIISPTDFDVSNTRVVFRPGQHEFIKQLQVRATHLIMVFNLFSVYNKAILYIFPLKGSAHPHSLILGGGALLKLTDNSYNYDKQTVLFTKPTGILYTRKLYNIWKRELSDACNDLNRYYTEKIIINPKDAYPLEINAVCRSVNWEQQNLPVVLYFASMDDQLDSVALRSFLQKGVMIVEFRGRGTFSLDLEHYLKGCGQNFSNIMDDLQTVIEFIGNNMTKNISLYCKGQIGSLVGLWFNIYFPFLFNSTVLHNGIYDLEDEIALKKLQYFLGKSQEQQKQSLGDKWKKFNIFKYKFRQPYRQPNLIENNREMRIGTLQNIIISSDSIHRIHSRKLIYRLRQNPHFKYHEVYLKQYEGHYETDLTNLSYIFSKIRERAQHEINDPADPEDPQDNN